MTLHPRYSPLATAQPVNGWLSGECPLCLVSVLMMKVALDHVPPTGMLVTVLIIHKRCSTEWRPFLPCLTIGLLLLLESPQAPEDGFQQR